MDVIRTKKEDVRMYRRHRQLSNHACAQRNICHGAVMEPRLAMIAWLHAKGSTRQRNV